MKVSVVFVGLALATSAVAQTPPSANSAFECNLPYKAAMMSMGGLTIKEQREPDIFERATNAIGIVEFEPEGVLVYGQKPSSLVLTIKEDKSRVRLGLPATVEAVYVAQFPVSVATDNSIKAAIPWSETGCTDLGICGRESSAENPNTLLYYRNSDEFLKLECSVSINQDEL